MRVVIDSDVLLDVLLERDLSQELPLLLLVVARDRHLRENGFFEEAMK